MKNSYPEKPEPKYVTMRFYSRENAENFKLRSGSKHPIRKHKNKTYSVTYRMADRTRPPRKNPQLTKKINTENLN